jgi:hypothetical protein
MECPFSPLALDAGASGIRRKLFDHAEMVRRLCHKHPGWAELKSKVSIVLRAEMCTPRIFSIEAKPF